MAWAIATTSRHGQSNSPPAGGEIPLRETTGAARRVVAPYRGRKPSHAGGHMGRPYKKKFNPRSRWRSNLPAFSQKRVSTFLGARDFKMLGGSKFRLRQDFCQGQKCLLTRPATEKIPPAVGRGNWVLINQSSASAGPRKPCRGGPRRGPSHARCRGWRPGSAPWPSWPARTCRRWRRSRRQRASPGSSWWSR